MLVEAEAEGKAADKLASKRNFIEKEDLARSMKHVAKTSDIVMSGKSGEYVMKYFEASSRQEKP